MSPATLTQAGQPAHRGLGSTSGGGLVPSTGGGGRPGTPAPLLGWPPRPQGRFSLLRVDAPAPASPFKLKC